MSFLPAEPLIPADNVMAVLAALFVISGSAFLLERTSWGKALTGTVWAILIAILLANLHVIPHSSAGYDVVFSYFVPLLIPLFLIKANLRKIFFETTRMAAAFGIAALATVIGVLVGALILDLGPQEAEITGLFTATYIGGSVNYAALAETTGIIENRSFLSAATAVDNLMSAIFLIFLSVAGGWSWLTNRFIARDHSGAGVEGPETVTSTERTSAMHLTLAAAFALSVVAVADAITAYLDLGPYRYLIITTLALIPPTAFPKTMEKLDGGFEMGVGLAFVFFAAIAAGADIQSMLEYAETLLIFAVILLSVHAVVLFGLGSMLKFSMPELITASNAAILGATTAPALAAAKGWRDLITPGVLVGVLGYAAGTFIGTGVWKLWEAVMG